MELIPDLIAKRADLSPSRIAMVDLTSGEEVSYAQLEDRSSRCAQSLSAQGVTEHDRVAVLCRNRIEFFEILFACGKIGALMVPLNWRLSVHELEDILKDCTPDILIHGAEDREAAQKLAGESGTLVDLDEPGPDGYAASLKRHEPASSRAHWPGSQAWYLLYTSGTTGRPKAVIQTYAMALVNYLNIGSAIDLCADDTTINFLPLFHTAGINLHTLPTLFAGGRVLVLTGFDPGRMIDLLAEGELDTFFGVPAVYQQLSLHPKFASVDLSKLRSWGCGGAPLPDILVTQFAERGARVCHGYGMTETGPTAFLMNTEDVEPKIGSVGKAQLLVSTKIMLPDGAEAGVEEIGEIWFCGPGITPGYWNQPEATAAAFEDGHWFKSGDLARKDSEGFHYIVGRSKEMYISGAENIYPAEVENVLAKHPAVLEAAVIGVPNEKWGEVGKAFTLFREGRSASAEELTEFCRDRLATYKVPKFFVPLDDFPRTAAGKVQKHLLPQPYAVK